MSPPQLARSALPTPWAQFELIAFQGDSDDNTHLALVLGDVADQANPAPPLVRIHSECLTGDALFSLRCDCGPQLQTALRTIAAEERGAVLYLRQEGRGIGLFNKIRAYQLQDQGADTVEANRRLGFPEDARDYQPCKKMLDFLGIRRLRLLTNNPEKIAALEELGLKVSERVPLHVDTNPFNEEYLQTKAHKMRHLIESRGVVE